MNPKAIECARLSPSRESNAGWRCDADAAAAAAAAAIWRVLVSGAAKLRCRMHDIACVWCDGAEVEDELSGGGSDSGDNIGGGELSVLATADDRDDIDEDAAAAAAAAAAADRSREFEIVRRGLFEEEEEDAEKEEVLVALVP